MSKSYCLREYGTDIVIEDNNNISIELQPQFEQITLCLIESPVVIKFIFKLILTGETSIM